VAFESDEQLLSDYNRWVAEKKVAGVDVSPTAFLVDRAKESAYNRVMEAIAFIKDNQWPAIMVDDPDGPQLMAIDSSEVLRILGDTDE